jgi:hypothetical protein
MSVSLLQAYSVYDEEIGYCQGQSFLAAVLLLHVSTHARTNARTHTHTDTHTHTRAHPHNLLLPHQSTTHVQHTTLRNTFPKGKDKHCWASEHKNIFHLI